MESKYPRIPPYLHPCTGVMTQICLKYRIVHFVNSQYSLEDMQQKTCYSQGGVKGVGVGTDAGFTVI